MFSVTIFTCLLYPNFLSLCNYDYDKIFMLDRVRKIYKSFPQISVPQQLEDDDDMQKLSEALGAAKTRVEVCSSFLKAAMK